MNKSVIAAMILGAVNVVAAGGLPAHSAENACKTFAWPHYPQECLVQEAGTAASIVRIAVENTVVTPVAETVAQATPYDIGPRFDDRNYFDPRPAHVNHEPL